MSLLQDVEMFGVDDSTVSFPPAFPPALQAELNKRLALTNPLIISAMDLLTPVKVRLYSLQGLSYIPQLYQFWRQALIEARSLHLDAYEALYAVSEFLSQTRDESYAQDQEWIDIQTKERAQKIMLRWISNDLDELGHLLTRYALGLVGPPPQTNVSRLRRI